MVTCKQDLDEILISLLLRVTMTYKDIFFGGAICIKSQKLLLSL